MSSHNIILVCIVIIVLAVLICNFGNTKETFINTDIPLLTYSNVNVFLINMKDKIERFNHFTHVYKKTDLGKNKDFIRIEAVNGRNLDLNEYVSEVGLKDIKDIEKRGYRTCHNQLTRGAVGCYLSHINIWKQICKLNEPYAIVFEDDIKFVYDDTFVKLKSAIKQVPKDWDILFLQCICHVCKFYEGYKEAKHFFLTHAYIIKKESAEKILSEIEFLPIRQQIDSELSSLATRGKIKLYCVRHPLAIQHSAVNATSIQMPLKRVDGINPYALF